MKLAIISLTLQGQKVAKQIAQIFENDHTVLRIDLFHKNVKVTLEKIFFQYDCILGIMASGIMIRNVCSLLRDKTKDPAILVMDEKAKHVITLLSGHIGGGNDYNLKIAEHLGADSVITTATDVIGKIGIDTLARKYRLNINNPSKIRLINKALLEGKIVELALPPQFEFIYEDKLVKESYRKIPSTFSKIAAYYNDTVITLTPMRLVVGLGARKGISKKDILLALDEVFNALRLPILRIDALATADPKKDEKGLLEVAKELGVPLEIVSLDELRKFKDSQCSESVWVMKVFGVSGVSEPAALLSAGRDAKLIFRKKAINRVTVAVAVANHP
jgi:cobalt-precorrin 5A hydrolase